MRRMVRFGGARRGGRFRLTVTAGGCSGYNAEFTVEAPLVGDEVCRSATRTFPAGRVASAARWVTIDFADTPSSTGLSFTIPMPAPAAARRAAAPARNRRALRRGYQRHPAQLRRAGMAAANGMPESLADFEDAILGAGLDPAVESLIGQADAPASATKARCSSCYPPGVRHRPIPHR